MQGKRKKKVLQKLINMSHVWKVHPIHTNRKQRWLGQELNHCTALPFMTAFHGD